MHFAAIIKLKPNFHANFIDVYGHKHQWGNDTFGASAEWQLPVSKRAQLQGEKEGLMTLSFKALDNIKVLSSRQRRYNTKNKSPHGGKKES